MCGLGWAEWLSPGGGCGLDRGPRESWWNIFSGRAEAVDPEQRGVTELPGPGNPGSSLGSSGARAASWASSLTASPVARRWENKDIYAAAIRSLRLRELQNVECVTAVRAGLGSIIPLQLLTTLSPLEMELRTCGLPYINLEFLKVGGKAGLGWAGLAGISAVARHMSQYFLCPPPVGGSCAHSHLTVRESLAKVTQPGSSRVRPQTQVPCLQSP